MPRERSCSHFRIRGDSWCGDDAAEAEGVGGARPDVALLAAERQDRAARAADAGRLIQLLHRARDVVGRLEDRVGVEDELDVGVELARLALDRRRLADRLAPADGEDLDVLRGAVRLGHLHRLVVAPIVHEDDAAGLQGLPQDRGDGEGDVLLLVQGGDDDVHAGLAPVFGGRGNGAVWPADQAEGAEDGARPEDEVGQRGHARVSLQP